MAQDNNAVYIWQATGKNADTLCSTHAPEGYVLVKFGITSARLGSKRLYDVAVRYGFTARVAAFESVPDARDVERSLLNLGTKAVGLYGDGSTEFRFVSQAELDHAIGLVSASAVVVTHRDYARDEHGLSPAGLRAAAATYTKMLLCRAYQVRDEITAMSEGVVEPYFTHSPTYRDLIHAAECTIEDYEFGGDAFEDYPDEKPLYDMFFILQSLTMLDDLLTQAKQLTRNRATQTQQS